VGFESLVEGTKSPTRVAGHRSVFVLAVTYFFSLSLWLASLFALRILVSSPSFLCHIFR
jgi:hypothetical protein